MGAQTLCILLMLCLASPVARADCPAAPIANPDDMAISFLTANGVQAASASLLASSIKEGTLIYDDTANKLKVCDGDNWIEVGSGSGTDTLASLSCASGEIPKYNGTAWACAADGGGSGTESVFAVSGTATLTGTTIRGFSSVGTNIGSAYNNSTGVFTAPEAGRYFFSGSVLPMTGTSATLQLFKSGTGVVRSYMDNADANNIPVSAAMDLAPGDTVSMNLTTGTLHANAWHSFTGFKLGGGAAGGGGGSSTMVAFEANRTGGANQTVTTNTWTKLVLATEVYDVGNAYDPATSRFMPQVAGKYVVSAGAYCLGVATACSVMIYKNGAGHSMMKPSSVASNDLIPRLTTIVDMNGSTDYIEAYAYTGGTTIGGSTMYTSFGAALLGGSSSSSDTLAGLSCATNEIPKWNGSAWACASDGGGSGGGGLEYFAGSGLLVGGITYHNVTPTNHYPVTVPPGTKAVKLTVNYHHQSATPNTHGYLSFSAYQKGQTNASKKVSYSSYHYNDYANSDIAYLDIPWDDSLDDEVTIQVTSSLNTDTLNNYAIYLAGYVVGGGGASSQWTDVAGGINYAGGKVGIGTTTPEASLVTVDTGTVTPRGIVASQYNTGMQAPLFVGKKARGTLGTPAGIESGDYLFALQGQGHNSTAFAFPQTIIGSIAAETWTPTSNATRTSFWTTPVSGTIAQERMRIDQTGGVSIGPGVDAHASSLLDLTSTTRGFLPPRMTTVQRDAIASPAVGLMIFDTTAAQYQFWSGTAWSGLGSGGVPTGTIAAFALTTCPTGWTEYTAARGRFLRGIDNGAGNDPDGTRLPGSAQDDELKSHSHGVDARVEGIQSGASNARQYATAGANGTDSDMASKSAGGAETRPKNVAVLYCQYSGSGGGGGATTLATLTDVDVSALANGKVLTYNSSSSKWEAVTPTGGGTPAPSNGYVQFNNAGAFGGDEDLFWDNTNKRLGIGNASPSYPLDVKLDTTKYLRVLDDNSAYQLRFGDASSAASTMSPTIWAEPGGNNTRRMYVISEIPAVDDAGNMSVIALMARQAGAAVLTTRPVLTIQNNDNVVMTVAASGNIGIGTTTPANIISTATALNSNTASALQLYNESSSSLSSSTGVIMRRGRGTLASTAHPALNDRIGYVFGSSDSGGTTAYAGVQMFATEAHTNTTKGMNMNFITTPNGNVVSAVRMVIDQNGNVGIGTTTPTAALDVVGSVYSSIALTARNGPSGSYGQLHGGNADGSFLKLNRAGNIAQNAYLAQYQGHLFLKNSDSGDIVLTTTTSDAERLRITAAGNVGIGTANPQDVLDLGPGTSGRSIVWGGSTGTNHYASVGTTYSSGSLSLVRGLKLATSGADQYLYSYGGDTRAGIRIGGGSASDISFFNEPPATQTVGNAFDYVANTKMTIKDSGNVGIGTSNPQAKLHVSGGASGVAAGGLRIEDNAGNYRTLYMTSNNATLGFYSGANTAFLSNAGVWTNASDIAIKKNITPISYGLDTVMKLRPVHYNMKSDDKAQVGFIAQEMKKVVPEVVEGTDGTLSLSYGNLVAVLTKAVQELKADNDNLHTALKAANDNHAAALEELRREIDALKAAR